MTRSAEGSAPRPFDDPVALGELLLAAPERDPHYHAALDVIDAYSGAAPLSAERREHWMAHLEGYALNALISRGSRPRLSELAPLVERACARRLEAAADLETMSRAMQGLRADDEAGTIVRRMYAHLLRAELPLLPVRSVDWSNRHIAPHRTHLETAAREIAAFASIVGWDELAIAKRLPDPHIEDLIGNLAGFWQRRTNKRPTSPDKGSAEAYRSPFARFVLAFWPAVGIGPPPSNKSIGRALDR